MTQRELQKKIEELRGILDKAIENKADSKKVLAISQSLDTLIEEYMQSQM